MSGFAEFNVLRMRAFSSPIVHASHVQLGIEPIFYPQSNENAVILPMSRA
jgi:hypothetical protein